MGNNNEKEKPDYEIVIKEKEEKKVVPLDILPPPSKVPFFNRDKHNKKRIDSYTEVVKSANNLLDSLHTHAKTKEKFKNIFTEIKIDNLKRDRELREEQEAKELFEKKRKLNNLNLDFEITEKEKRLSDLQRQSAQTINKEKPKVSKIKKIEELTKIEKKVLTIEAELKDSYIKAGYSEEDIEARISEFRQRIYEVE